ncbi:MAG: hypothetical protein GY719_40275 [bacterium]|nr:hypothetical protein [bacterium]
MLRLLADENFNNAILRGLRLRNPDLDLVRVQDVGLSGEEDPVILEWAARHGRVLLTHDKATIPRFAYERVKAGQPMAGACEVSRSVPMSQAIDEILLIAECSDLSDWESQIRELPL